MKYRALLVARAISRAATQVADSAANLSISIATKADGLAEKACLSALGVRCQAAHRAFGKVVRRELQAAQALCKAKQDTREAGQALTAEIAAAVKAHPPTSQPFDVERF